MTVWIENSDHNMTPARQQQLQAELQEKYGDSEKVIVLPFGSKVVLDRAAPLACPHCGQPLGGS